MLNAFATSCLFTQNLFELNVATPTFIAKPENDWKNSHSSYQDYVVSKVKSGAYQSVSGNKTAWIAFSDRENNLTFQTPNGANFTKLDFMEKVYIADIKNGWALVFTDDNIVNYPRINKSAQFKGWISIDKLLLWNKCPKNAQNILEKGLIVQDLEKIKGTSNEIKFLSAPSTSSTKRGNAAQLDIPFIMKTERINGEEFFLLSYYSEIVYEGRNQSFTVLGWLSEEHITKWNQRLCIEPASENVSCLKDKRIYPTFFGSLSSARSFFNNPSNKNEAIKDFKETFNTGIRQKGYIMRSPILKAETDNIFNVVVIGSDEAKDIDMDKLKKDLEDAKNKLNNINVIFVIDATSSMKSYFPEIAKALDKIIRKDFSQKVKIGVVVYRNVADGSKEIEYRKVTNNYVEIINFIGSTECKSNGNGYYESFYKGLETALDNNKMDYQISQSNFIIAIGDCGNKDDENKLKEIGNKLNRNNIHFFAYNVAAGDDKAYRRYKNQVTKLLEYSIDNNEYCIAISGSETYQVFKKNKDNCTNIKSADKFGGLRLASDGKVAIGTFNSIITSTVMDFVSSVNEQIEILQDRISSGGKGKINAGGNWNWDNLCEIMTNRGYWTKDDCRKFSQYGGASKLASYAPREVSVCSEVLFDYVLFFSGDELKDLVQVLKKVNPQKNKSQIYDDLETRKKYQDALINLGLSFLGEKENKIREMNFEEFLQKMYGIPVKINNCGITSIKDITNSSIIDAEAFLNFANKFSDKTRKLENILRGTYNESFTMNGKPFYWVPFKDMPGYCAE